MPRTTDELVRGVIELDDDFSTDPFILAANELVTELCEPLGYTDGRLQIIETWLAAHLCAIKDMRRSSESIKGVTETYQYKVDLHLNVTVYGQQAQIFDTKLGLAVLNKEVKNGTGNAVQVFCLGSNECP